MRVWLVYIRKSVVRDDTDLESPERQLYVCKTRLSLTESGPYEIEVYQDLDRSGSTESGRPEWLRLKEQLSRPEVAGVVASSLDRLYRNVSEFLTFLNEIEVSKKVLITSKESLDTSSPLGRFVVTILMALFEMEWRLTSARMVDMIEHKRRHQGRHWGVAPFGCDRDPAGQLVPSQRTYTLNSETRYYFDALAECYRIYAGGSSSYEQTAAALNAAGWRFYDRDFTTGEWNVDRVRGVINRWRMYRGDLPLGNPLKSTSLEWVPGGHQPILPIELCNKVGTILEKRSRRGWSRAGKKHRLYLLSGLLYCQCCGQELNGQFAHSRLYRHRLPKQGCPEKWLQADAIEEELVGAMIELVQRRTILNDVMSLATLTRAESETYAKISRVREQLNRLEDLYLTEGGISKSNYLARRGEFLNELARLEADEGSDPFPMIEEMLLSFETIRYAEPDTKKALISNVIERLEVKSGHIVGLTPQTWARPFFETCRIWAGWESNPHEG